MNDKAIENPKEYALAKRAVACKAWRWLPGMRAPDADGSAYPFLPDLTDPATLGCLLAMVRKAWGDPLICIAVDNTGCGWWLDGWADSRVPSKLHDTEAEALLAALEAAPCLT